MNLLTIVVPFYNETERDIFPLLSSINIQKGLDLNDVNIILVNDGYKEYEISTQYFDIFEKLNIELIKCEENKGPGVARQVGLDNASGKYVMFCDCDDLLHNTGVLSTMILEMEQHECEFLSTSWLEELEKDTFFNHEIEQTWLHGKMFLREFLYTNNIRFHEKLRVHEDTYFLKLVTAFTKNRRHLNIVSYIWAYSPNSITRKDNAIYGFASMDIFVFAVLEATKKLKENVDESIIQLVAYIYFIAQSKEWQKEESKQYLEKMVNSLALNMSDYWSYFDNADEEFINNIYSIEFAKKTVRDIPKVNLYEFVEEVKKLSS